ncbi:asparagine synthase glutamine-hydrolyzing AsnB4 [Butyrivibrio proteoclasticus B316]|uniref:asparagine synthase (glutamine-hydrolyzing) n=1 Tax=Butyrivibrio proteoclasticus (strain ATCC 51982 / DSM 14932 / B316) TaxID=515622 RepID=E0RZI4_BUTPB|nr:asparagine synthase (glutamine-hydrolyzing) [Butyrivibrio proteoclasticus]ADL33181.1 asparagine synthase glutamine-hydrolyzing AsnB4 [Butyrivibrio proteoclasticus B316]
MCGIAGFCHGKDDSIDNIKNMTDRIRHRGPDSFGYWKTEDDSVVLGHRRLAILDVSEAGSQPMISASGDYVIAFNGEIYNHKQLTEKIRNKNIHFRSITDTEILLEAFEYLGIDKTLEAIKGMFAIALYDRKNKELFLVRDRAGEKPLYYGFINGRFTFASELSCFTALDDFKREIDYSATELFFRRGYIPAPFSIYKGIKKLEPGHYLKIKEPYDTVEDITYWSSYDKYVECQKNKFNGSMDEAAEIIESLLKDSISGQMISDVPLGAFLSAGIDSTTIISLMQQVSSQPIRSFTIGVDSPEYNEAPIAAQTAKILGTKHTEKYVSVEELKSVIPSLSKIYTEPFADSSQIPTSIISQIAKQDVTVVLSGDGGDELFCGYPRYNGWVTDSWSKQKKLPFGIQHARARAMMLAGKSKNDPYVKRLMASSLPELYAAVSVSDTSFLKNPDNYQDYFDLFPSDDILSDQDRLMAMDFKMYLPDDILAKVDRASMIHSLETRVPFLDRDVIEFAWRLPLEYKFHNGVTKRVLRKIVYTYVPKELLERPKTGFSIPLDKWMRDGELREWAEALMSPASIESASVLDTNSILKMWRDYIDGGKWNESIWYVLVYLDWLHRIN